MAEPSQDLAQLVAIASEEISSCQDLTALEHIRVGLLGRKGEITALLKTLGSLEPEARRAAGAKINEAKETLTRMLDARRGQLEQEQLERSLAAQIVDVTLPGRGQLPGAFHPVTRVRM